MVAAPVRRQPTRTCVVCRTARAKRDLVRIVRRPEGGGLVLDPGGRLPGRGAYLCADGACTRDAVRRRLVERALGAPLPAELRAELLGTSPTITPSPTSQGGANRGT